MLEISFLHPRWTSNTLIFLNCEMLHAVLFTGTRFSIMSTIISIWQMYNLFRVFTSNDGFSSTTTSNFYIDFSDLDSWDIAWKDCIWMLFNQNELSKNVDSPKNSSLSRRYSNIWFICIEIAIISLLNTVFRIFFSYLPPIISVR